MFNYFRRSRVCIYSLAWIAHELYGVFLFFCQTINIETAKKAEKNKS